MVDAPPAPPADMKVQCRYCGFEDLLHNVEGVEPNDTVECSFCGREQKFSQLIKKG